LKVTDGRTGTACWERLLGEEGGREDGDAERNDRDEEDRPQGLGNSPVIPCWLRSW